MLKHKLYRPLVASLLLLMLLTLCRQPLSAQEPDKPFKQGIAVSPQISEGIPINAVIILLHKESGVVIADSAETAAFYKAFNIKPGQAFRQALMDLAINNIKKEAAIRSADYELFSTELSGALILVVHAYFLKKGELKVYEGKKGMTSSGKLSDFPVLIETDHSKLMFILNGGAGLFNEVNAFFSKGPEFTKGNPVADNPAQKGVRFWGETYLEPGIAGITKLGKSKLYAYGAITALISARNSSDIYSEGPTVFLDVERMYAGLLAVGLGKKNNINVDLSVGRQFYQLNDGFLISKFSGSANAGERGSVYLNSRTAFEKTISLKSQIGKFTLDAFFLEPQELFKASQSNTSYAGTSLQFNDNKHVDLGLSYIASPSGTGKYSTPQGPIQKKGMYIINPKFWLRDIGGTGLYLKSEYAYQGHNKEDMRSNAWYIGLGIQKKKWKYQPSLYYRYAYMNGDDSSTKRNERFDPMLTGGLGNWVQGINFRKIAGNGNIISHRVEAKAYLSKQFELSLDYFFLFADTYSNLGSLAPISKLSSRNYGQEITLTARYFLGKHFMLLGVLSHAIPGKAIEMAFPDPVYPWTSVQAAIFMFF